MLIELEPAHACPANIETHFHLYKVPAGDHILSHINQFVFYQELAVISHLVTLNHTYVRGYAINL